MSKKKFTKYIFPSFLFIFFFTNSLFAQINVTLPSITRAPGSADEYINVDVGSITSQDGITSFQFDVYYDKTVIKITDASTSGLSLTGGASPVFNADTAHGRIRVAWASAMPISGSGTLAKLKVKFISEGTTALTFIKPSTLQNTFIFNNGTPAANTSDGSITVGTPPSTVMVMAPNGGEDWHVGTQQNIMWAGSGLTDVKIEYSTDNGSNWISIVNSTSAVGGTYQWTIPDTPTEQALVRITDANNSSVSDTSDAVFTISLQPSINVLTPNGGESWQSGTNQNITWNSVNVSNVKIEYSTDNGGTWGVISASVPSTPESFSWDVPNTPTDNALIKISDAANANISDISNSVFTIAPPPSVNVVSPNGGENWEVGSTNDITWTSESIENVMIEYSLDNGQNWVTITDSIPAVDKSYSWTLPDSATSQALVKISDISNSSISDVSDAAFSISLKPSLVVTAPNGGEVWEEGTSHDIMWTSVNVDNIKIEYSVDGGTSWSTLEASTPSDGSYTWNVPSTPTSQAMVRLSDVNDASVIDESDTVFTISQTPSITVLAPNGGENWQVGSNQDITWNSINVAKVKIEYSINNGSSWLTVKDSLESSGTYSWTIPNTLSTQAKIKVSDISNGLTSDESDAAFTISAVPQITVSSPNGGEKWQVESTHDITWTSTNVANVNLDYSIDNGTNWVSIAANIPSSGTYSWTIPNTPSAQAKVKVSDADNSAVMDESDAIFTISQKPSITITSPNGGEEWKEGTSQNITWSSINVANVAIEYSTDNGANWNSIISSTPSSGMYSWTIPSVESDQALVKISDAADANVSDISDAVFTLKKFTNITDDFTSSVPKEFALYQNFPNPFNPTTKIFYSVPHESNVVIKVYNTLGKEIVTLVSERKAAGNYAVDFNGTGLESGVYFYSIHAGSFTSTKKFILMK